MRLEDRSVTKDPTFFCHRVLQSLQRPHNTANEVLANSTKDLISHPPQHYNTAPRKIMHCTRFMLLQLDTVLLKIRIRNVTQVKACCTNRTVRFHSILNASWMNPCGTLP